MKHFNFLFFSFCISFFSKAQQWKAVSPNQSLQIVLKATGGGITYQVFYSNDEIVKASALGIESSMGDFSKSLSIVRSSSRKINERYSLAIGKRKVNQASANETSVLFRSDNNQLMQVDLRAYNDGVAFRYSFPGIENTTEITNELTEFAFSTGGKVWLEPYDVPTQWGPAYEAVYQNGIPIGTASKEGGGWAFPALFQTAGYWLLLTESNLTKDFYGSKLDSICSNGVYKIAKPQPGEGNGTGKITATATKPFSTPWRVMMIGKKLGTIVESNLVYNVADPNKVGDVSWVKPGRASWSWWGDHESSKNFLKLKKFVDLAKEMGWEYSLVDANWDIMKGGDIKQLAAYAKRQNIGLILWYNSGGSHNTVTERPRDIISDPVRRKADFKKLRALGVVGVKVDFFQSDKQNIIQLYQDILMDAAKEKIMVNFHGCTLPRGWSRTYPNLVSMEAVRGAENYGWSKEFAAQAPEINNIYTYTRNVVGPMDYTPVTFSDYECCRHTTTNTHELALSIVFESGILHFADRAEPYQALDKRIKKFLKIVPVTWDETKFIQGEPGKETVLARRSGTTWYVAGINGEDAQKNIVLALPFVTGAAYRASFFADGKSAGEINTREFNWKKGSPVEISMLPKGGFVLVLQPIK